MSLFDAPEFDDDPGFPPITPAVALAAEHLGIDVPTGRCDDCGAWGQPYVHEFTDYTQGEHPDGVKRAEIHDGLTPCEGSRAVRSEGARGMTTLVALAEESVAYYPWHQLVDDGALLPSQNPGYDPRLPIRCPVCPPYQSKPDPELAERPAIPTGGGHLRCACGAESEHIAGPGRNPNALDEVPARRVSWHAAHRAQSRDVGEWPHPQVSSWERDRGLSFVVDDDELASFDTVPFRLPRWVVPLPADGLEIGRHADGSWRTFMRRYPGSVLTSGHESAHEAYWAAHALAEFAPWDLLIDITVPEPGEPSWSGVRLLAGRVERVGERFAEHRAGLAADLTPEITMTTRSGLPIGKKGRDWAVFTPDGQARLVGYRLSSKAKATAAAAKLAALADWSLPAYVFYNRRLLQPASLPRLGPGR